MGKENPDIRQKVEKKLERQSDVDKKHMLKSILFGIATIPASVLAVVIPSALGHALEKWIPGSENFLTGLGLIAMASILFVNYAYVTSTPKPPGK